MRRNQQRSSIVLIGLAMTASLALTVSGLPSAAVSAELGDSNTAATVPEEETKTGGGEATNPAESAAADGVDPGVLITSANGQADAANLSIGTNAELFTPLGDGLPSVDLKSQLTPEYDEDYTFTLQSIGEGDGFVKINGVEVKPNTPTKVEGLKAGKPVELTGTINSSALYPKSGRDANSFLLRWESDSQPLATIPNANFTYPADARAKVIPSEKPNVVELRTDSEVKTAPKPGDVKLVSGGVPSIEVPPLEVESVAVDSDDPSTLLVTTKEAVNFRVGMLATIEAVQTVDGDQKFSGVRLGDQTQSLATDAGKKIQQTSEADLNGKDRPYNSSYPRPQLERGAWENLNGMWEFENTEADAQVPTGKSLDEKILVPYPMESELSRVGEHYDYSLYRRSFDVDQSWKIGDDNRYFINFGAVDYASWVYINGKRVDLKDTYTKNEKPMPDTEAQHSGKPNNVGGFAGFSIDATDYLVDGEEQEIVVKVEDKTDLNNQPTGKQQSTPSGIWYTPNSGIWQTVWAEPRPVDGVKNLDVESDLEFDESTGETTKSDLDVTVNAQKSGTAKVEVLNEKGTVVGSAEGKTNEPVTISVKNPKLWSPKRPYLYSLRVEAGGEKVESYTTLRKIEVKKDENGTQRVHLNGEPTFMLSMLDQGWWPDGLLTAPDPKSLKYDLEKQKQWGFNAVRKHIKTEPDIWYKDADALGIMVMQDMPNVRPKNLSDPLAIDRYTKESERVVDDLSSFNSVSAWIPFNEGWGTPENGTVKTLLRDLFKNENSRVVLPHTGQNIDGRPDVGFIGDGEGGPLGSGELNDAHAYPGPVLGEPDENRGYMDGEHGGYSVYSPANSWMNVRKTYEFSEDLSKDFEDNNNKIVEYNQEKCLMSGSVYTQPTDVEGEVNGFMTYDRKVIKPDENRVAASNKKILAACDETVVRDGPDDEDDSNQDDSSNKDDSGNEDSGNKEDPGKDDSGNKDDSGKTAARDGGNDSGRDGSGSETQSGDDSDGSAAPGGNLPRTGADVAGMVGLAAALVVGGSVLLYVLRRRRHDGN